MNRLAKCVFQTVTCRKPPEGSETALLNAEERSALLTILPLIQATPELLKKLLDEGETPELWMMPPKSIAARAK